MAAVWEGGKSQNLGTFATAEQAALVYARQDGKPPEGVVVNGVPGVRETAGAREQLEGLGFAGARVGRREQIGRVACRGDVEEPEVGARAPADDEAVGPRRGHVVASRSTGEPGARASRSMAIA